MTTKTLTAAEAVRAGRKAAGELRVPRLMGRNHRATERLLDVRRRELQEAYRALLALGRRDLAAALREEHNLTQRVAKARHLGQDRPELRARLAAARATLRDAAAEEPKAKVTATTATAISAALRRGGWMPVPRHREGLHVTTGRRVTVTFGWDSARQNHQQAVLVARYLEDLGYLTTGGNEASEGVLYVLGRKARS